MVSHIFALVPVVFCLLNAATCYPKRYKSSRLKRHADLHVKKISGNDNNVVGSLQGNGGYVTGSSDYNSASSGQQPTAVRHSSAGAQGTGSQGATGPRTASSGAMATRYSAASGDQVQADLQATGQQTQTMGQQASAYQAQTTGQQTGGTQTTGQAAQTSGQTSGGQPQLAGSQNQIIGSINGQGNTAIGQYNQQVNQNTGHVMNFQNTAINGGFNVGGRKKRSAGDAIQIGITGNGNQAVGKVTGGGVQAQTSGQTSGGQAQLAGNQNQIIGSINGQGNTAIGQYNQQVNKNNGHVMNFKNTAINGGFNVGGRKRRSAGDTIQIGINGNGNQAVGKVTGGGSVAMTQGGTSNLLVNGGGVFDDSFPFDNIKIGIQGNSNQAVGKVGRGKRDVNGNANQIIASIVGQGNKAIGKFCQEVNENNGHVMNFRNTKIHGGFNVGGRKKRGTTGDYNQIVGSLSGKDNLVIQEFCQQVNKNNGNVMNFLDTLIKGGFNVGRSKRDLSFLGDLFKSDGSGGIVMDLGDINGDRTQIIGVLGGENSMAIGTMNGDLDDESLGYLKEGLAGLRGGLARSKRQAPSRPCLLIFVGEVSGENNEVVGSKNQEHKGNKFNMLNTQIFDGWNNFD